MPSSSNKILLLIAKQIDDINKGGIPILNNKIKRFILLFFESVISLPFLPIILVIRIISPFKLVRIRKLRSDRLGHFAFEPDIYLLERLIGKHNKKTIDLFYCLGRVCNEQLKIMLERRLFIFSK